MTSRRLRIAALLALATIGLAPTARGDIRPDAGPSRPNILLMLADDMGWGDLSCYGNRGVRTPNIDRIAAEGARLTQFYAASAVCTPTRISVLTGKYPLRFDVRAIFRDTGEFLPTCNTLPKLLRRAGYRTAHAGKWHLGGVRLADLAMRDRSPGPREHGFDHYLTQIEEQPLRGRLARERVLYREGGTCLLRDDRPVAPADPYYTMHLTDILGEEAIRQVRASHAEGRPFFVNLWWLDPHQPYEPAPEPHWSATATEGITEDQHRFRSMVARMDYQVGRLLATLDELGQSDDTLVLFTSDNGGAYEANNAGLKAGKTDLHEGGIRVPFLARWPGRIRPGTTSDVLGHSNDLMPTCCAAAGATLPDGDRFDGEDLLPLLTGADETLDRGTVFWQLDLIPNLQRHEPKPRPYATEAARRGHWKLLARDGRPVGLFDIAADPGEATDRLGTHPAIAESLRVDLADWLAEPRRPPGRVD